MTEDTLKQLWAPWRLAYVSVAKEPAADEGCFICRGLAESDDRRNLISWRRPHSVVLLNRFPYNNGHLLIAPRGHKGRLGDLGADEHVELMDSLQRMMDVLDERMHPDGYNIGLNIGKAAGAGLPGHLHWHLVPRWQGDTNFMPVLADIRVMPQHLNTTWKLLRDAWANDEETKTDGV